MGLLGDGTKSPQEDRRSVLVLQLSEIGEIILRAVALLNALRRSQQIKQTDLAVCSADLQAMCGDVDAKLEQAVRPFYEESSGPLITVKKNVDEVSFSLLNELATIRAGILEASSLVQPTERGSLISEITQFCGDFANATVTLAALRDQTKPYALHEPPNIPGNRQQPTPGLFPHE